MSSSSDPNFQKSILVFALEILRVGALGFGGPLVTLNLMKEAFVKKLNWISEKEFLERTGMIKLLPGPVSSLMAVALGRKFFGYFGSLVAIVAYLLPAFLLVIVWDLAAETLGATLKPGWNAALLWTFKTYIAAAIFIASYKLLLDAWKSFPLAQKWRFLIFFFIFLVAAVAIYFGRVESEIIALSLGVALMFYSIIPKRDRLYSLSVAAVLFVFFVASLVIFGTGYMLFPYVERELVLTGLLSEKDFATGIVIGNLSPGPVVIAATFYGWKLAGLGGALAATVGVFGGPFILMNVIYKTLEKLRSKPVIQHLSLCIIPAVVIVLLKFNWGFLTAEALDFSKVLVFLVFSLILYIYRNFLVHLGLILLVAGAKILTTN